MGISAGAKRNLLVLQFATALLQISKTDEVFNDDDLVKRTNNKDYHLNKRIDRALQALNDRMGNTISVIIQKEGYPLSKWLRAALDSKVMPTLKSITAKTINLELLSLWCLYVCFSEAKKPLIEEFEEYRDAEQYFRIIELMSETEIAKLESTLFQEAYKIVAILKG